MRVVKAITLFVLIMGLAWFIEIARFSWDDWASLLVQRTHQPLELKLTNDTPQRIPVLDVGIAGWVCQACCVDPGEQVTCRPTFAEASNVFIQIGVTIEEAFPHTINAPHE